MTSRGQGSDIGYVVNNRVHGPLSFSFHTRIGISASITVIEVQSIRGEVGRYYQIYRPASALALGETDLRRPAMTLAGNANDKRDCCRTVGLWVMIVVRCSFLGRPTLR